MSLNNIRFFITLLCIGMIIGCKDEIPETTVELKIDIQEKLQELEGDFAVAFKNIDDSTQTVLIKEREMFHAASTMKTPVMIELFKQAASGRFRWMILSL